MATGQGQEKSRAASITCLGRGGGPDDQMLVQARACMRATASPARLYGGSCAQALTLTRPIRVRIS